MTEQLKRSGELQSDFLVTFDTCGHRKIPKAVQEGSHDLMKVPVHNGQ